MSSPISIYDPSRFDSAPHGYTLEQCKAGGRTRARTAKRHKWGFFLPKNDTVSLPEEYVHGRAGGVARSSTAKRINGKFVKE